MSLIILILLIVSLIIFAQFYPRFMMFVECAYISDLSGSYRVKKTLFPRSNH